MGGEAIFSKKKSDLPYSSSIPCVSIKCYLDSLQQVKDYIVLYLLFACTQKIFEICPLETRNCNYEPVNTERKRNYTRKDRKFCQWGDLHSREWREVEFTTGLTSLSCIK